LLLLYGLSRFATVAVFYSVSYENLRL